MNDKTPEQLCAIAIAQYCIGFYGKQEKHVYHNDLLDIVNEFTAPLRTKLAELEKNYNELLYAVGNKYPNETRHQTAKRYIRQFEERHTTGEGHAVAIQQTGKETK